jgi:hypothetical protein
MLLTAANTSSNDSKKQFTIQMHHIQYRLESGGQRRPWGRLAWGRRACLRPLLLLLLLLLIIWFAV